ncbi:MAG TPA: pilus assembly PilX N-terminal domain-containing protein [Vicinamibacterales bacterium]|nr:pilus assembly PilX N-terminal domain-containing protein [Vicinamibacterales bacterium]
MRTHDMRSERGIALVFVLFLLTTVSALAVSLTFLANSETYASGNYKLATQARYAAESSAQKVADYLLGATYNPATVAPGGLVNNTGSPVTFGGQPVVLTSNANNSVYPDNATKQAFAAMFTGPAANLVAGNTTLTMSATATLIFEDAFSDAYLGGTTIVQTWQITAQGNINGVRTATVEITATVETPEVPAFKYAAFANNNQCQALWFHGSSDTNSYNSQALATAAINGQLPANTPPTVCAPGVTGPQCMFNKGGDVGTNGNMLIDGGAVNVYGNLSTPRTGVGNCNQGNITALSGAAADIKGGAPLQLPGQVKLPTPAIQAPSTLPSVSISANNANQLAHAFDTTCDDLGFGAGGANFGKGTCGASYANPNNPVLLIQNMSAGPLSLPQITLNAQVSLVLAARTPGAGVSNEYDFNAIKLDGGASIGVSTPSQDAQVVVRIAGKDNNNNNIDPAINFVGGTFTAPVGTCATCSKYDAALLQFVYGGTNSILMKGNSSASATFYAPNSPATLIGDDNLYGAIIADTIEVAGNASIYYDTTLQTASMTKGQPIMTAFSWKNKNN